VKSASFHGYQQPSPAPRVLSGDGDTCQAFFRSAASEIQPSDRATRKAWEAEPYLRALLPGRMSTLVQQPEAPILRPAHHGSPLTSMRRQVTGRDLTDHTTPVVHSHAVPEGFSAHAPLLRALRDQVGIVGAALGDERYDDICVRGAPVASGDATSAGEAYLHYITGRLQPEDRAHLTALYGPAAVGWTPPRKY
jgi:hypothetical protein